MLSKNIYHRSFIILQNRESGYGIAENREPTGYCKLEIRGKQGKMSLYVQGLKPAERADGVYEWIMVSNIQGILPVKIAEIQVDGRGRGEATAEFDPNNVFGSGRSIDQYHALAVISRPLHERGFEVHYPLVGYASKRVEVDWTGRVSSDLRRILHERVRELEAEEPGAKQEEQYRDAYESTYKNLSEEDIWQAAKDDLYEEERLVEYLREEPPREIRKPVERIRKPVEEIEKPVEEIQKPVEEIEKPVEEIQKPVEEIQKPVEEIEKPVEEIQKPAEEIEKPVEEIEKPEEKPVEEIEKPAEEELAEEREGEKGKKKEPSGGVQFFEEELTYWDRTKDYYNRLFATHKLVTPFEENLGTVEWIRIQQINAPMVNYPGYGYTQAYAGGMQDHYLIGLQKERDQVKYVIYGVPSPYSAMPPLAMIGFSRWVPVKSHYGMGYWLLYIDAKTGCVVYPT